MVFSLKNIKSSLLLQKILWTMGTVFVYMLGRSIPVTTVPLNEGIFRDVALQNALNNLASVTGGQLSSITLFSLGISPWMTSMILWRFLTLFDMFKGYTAVQLSRARFFLTFLIALIQAFGLTTLGNFVEIEGLGDSSPLVARIVTMTILISGAFVLTWLGEMNSARGIGGPTIIIIVNMILIFFTNLVQYITRNDFSLESWLIQAGIFAISLTVLVLITIITYRAEYRILIKRIGIHNSFSKDTYIPIRLNPAGGLPFMYGMTLMMLPPIIIVSLLNFFPNNETLLYLSQNIGLSSLPGVIIYIAILYILTIGFSFYNYDPTDIAKNMQQNGDYIDNVRPGKPTAKYIQGKLMVLAQIGAIFVCVFSSAPLLFVVGNDGNTSLALLVSNVFIITSLLLGFIEQVDMLRSWKKYEPLL